MSGEQNIVLFNRETGEALEGCPDCASKDDVIVQLERQIRTLSGRLTRLQRDEESESKKHKLWDEAAALHDWWAIATGHFRADFGLDDFKDMLPRLKEKKFGPIGVLQGIAGAAHAPQQKELPNGRFERYDSLELVCRSPKKLEAFQNRAPGELEGNEWKRWLIDRIESNLSE